MRTLIRRTITGKKLAGMGTAAQSEAATQKTPVDTYLDLTPWLTALIVATLASYRPGTLRVAGPILFLWFSSKLFSQWLNRPPRREKNVIPEQDRQFLRQVALRTWRFFRSMAARLGFLIPDNVQEQPAAVAHRISPTNLGLLLNARLAAYDLGYLTLREFVSETAATLQTMERLPRYAGHFFNWYDTRTLQPLDPLFVSTVDSGNLAACLWTLKQGCLELRSAEPIHPALWQGIRDHLEQIPGSGDVKLRIAGFGEDSAAWLSALPQIEAEAAAMDSELSWWLSETRSRLEALHEAAANPTPSGELEALAARAGALVEEMDFGLVYNPERKLLSVGYNVIDRQLVTSCYDLMASEARAANFIAVAKNDVPQESWFHLGRTHALWSGSRVLLSWTGTMFEYLLPMLWMNVYPNTILEQSLHAVVKCQQRYGRRKGRPWGVSEAAYAVTDLEGNYQYRAFGVPELALKDGVSGAVVAPYASALALMVEVPSAVANLRRMDAAGWMGALGFYDSCDFTGERQTLVQTWMSHHQGMILLAIANVLTGCPMQRRFHAEPQVKANELILHEKAPASILAESAKPVEEEAGAALEPALIKGR